MCWSPCGQRRLTQFWRTRLERTLIHAQAEGLLLCIGANAACINTVSRMGGAKRTAECGSAQQVVAAAAAAARSLASTADADAENVVAASSSSFASAADADVVMPGA